MVIGFSDGSKHFASSVIYLVSYNPNSSEYAVNMVSSLSRLGSITKIVEKIMIRIPCQNANVTDYSLLYAVS